MHVEGYVELTIRYYMDTASDTSTAAVNTISNTKGIKEKFPRNVGTFLIKLKNIMCIQTVKSAYQQYLKNSIEY